MNLKLIYQKLLLAFINLLYYPNILGYWSDNNAGGQCITNKECTKIRWIGKYEWGNWDNNPKYERPYNENVTYFAAEDISIKTVWYILTHDWAEPKVFFTFSFLLLETAAFIFWASLFIQSKPPLSYSALTEVNILVTLIFTAINAFVQLLIRKQD